MVDQPLAVEWRFLHLPDHCGAAWKIGLGRTLILQQRAASDQNDSTLQTLVRVRCRVVNIELQYPHFIESWVERRSFNLFSFIHEAKIFDDFTGAGREARDYTEAIVGDIAPPIHDLLPNTIKIMLLT